MGHHNTLGLAVDRFRAFVSGQPIESGDELIVAGRDLEQVLVVRGWGRADIFGAGSRQIGEVRGTVLPGIEDDGQPVIALGVPGWTVGCLAVRRLCGAGDEAVTGRQSVQSLGCLLYTSDAADEEDSG